MPVYAVMCYSHSGGDEPQSATLIGAFSSFSAAADFLSAHAYRKANDAGTYWEWGWGTAADIIELPIDGEISENVMHGDACWNGKAN